MKQYKIVDEGFILGINSSFGIKITSEEYQRIKKALEKFNFTIFNQEYYFFTIEKKIFLTLKHQEKK